MSGMMLLRIWLDCDFKTAAKKVDNFLGRNFVMDDKKIAEQKKLKAYHNRIWGEATEHTGHIAAEYLERRGLKINELPDCLRGHAGLDCDGKIYTAMLALITGKDGKPVAIHRTFILPDGKTIKKITPPIGTITGGAVRLYEAEKFLAIAEGIETALAVTEQYEVPCWAAISAHGMATISIPTNVTTVHIFADNDSSYTGLAAAFKLANRLVVQEKKDVKVFSPDGMGRDFLDVLNEGD
jgi:putative DNA primase/helicase